MGIGNRIADDRVFWPNPGHPTVGKVLDELGLRGDTESTDLDKFDDGEEVFGITKCPGGDNNCGYGDLPRSADALVDGLGAAGLEGVPEEDDGHEDHHPEEQGPQGRVQGVPSSPVVATVAVSATGHFTQEREVAEAAGGPLEAVADEPSGPLQGEGAVVGDERGGALAGGGGASRCGHRPNIAKTPCLSIV